MLTMTAEIDSAKAKMPNCSTPRSRTRAMPLSIPTMRMTAWLAKLQRRPLRRSGAGS